MSLNRKRHGRQYSQQAMREVHPAFTDQLFKYLRYWPLFAGLLLVCTAAAWLYIKFKVPLYESTAAILINDERKGTDDGRALESLNAFTSKKIVENEVEVLKSRTLLNLLVKNLHLYANITEDEPFANRSAYLSSPIRIMAENPEQLRATKNIPLEYNRAKNEVIIKGKQYPLNKWVQTAFGTLQFTRNAAYTPPAQAHPLFFSLQSLKETSADISKRLLVTTANKLSTVIDLSIVDEVPKRGEDILNELISVYNQAAIVDKNRQAANTLAFVEDRLRYVAHELDSIEGRLQQFKAKSQIVDLSTQGRVFLENVGATDQKISEMNVQLAMLNQIEDYVQGKAGAGSIVPSTLGITDPLLQDLLKTLYDTELQVEKTKKIAPENNPVLISLTDQIKKIKPSILENIQSQRRNLQAGKNNLYTTNSKYISLLQNIPEKERELLEISRQQTIKNNIYTYLLQKREEASLSYAAAVGDSRLIDRAESSIFPLSPKKPLIYLGAVIGALALSFSYIKLKQLLNTKISSPEEVERYTSIPVFSEVALFDLKYLRMVREEGQHVVAEQFRLMRTSLSYLGIDAEKMKILVTSSIAEEGKSFIVANLGLSLTLPNKKVVLVEFDLRNPRLSQAFDIQGRPGITEYLNGQATAEDILYPTNLSDRLYVIPTGSLPANPSELLLGSAITKLFAYLEEEFDYILVDSPPVSPVTDAYLLSPFCDATLYVVRQGVTPRSLIQTLDERFQTQGLKNPAIIFNGMKRGRFGNDQYRYSYHYHYPNNRKQTNSRKQIPKLFS